MSEGSNATPFRETPWERIVEVHWADSDGPRWYVGAYSTGAQLAILGTPNVDMATVITAAEGCTINELAADHGLGGVAVPTNSTSTDGEGDFEQITHLVIRAWEIILPTPASPVPVPPPAPIVVEVIVNRPVGTGPGGDISWGGSVELIGLGEADFLSALIDDGDDPATTPNTAPTDAHPTGVTVGVGTATLKRTVGFLARLA